MDISLPQNIINLLNKKVAEGLFCSFDDALTFAVNFTFSDDKNIIPQKFIDNINAMIDESMEDIENGRYRDGHEVMEEFLKKYA